MLNVITDNLDVWTTAQKQKKAVGRGRAKKEEGYGIKKLRELILELAVRGKLVPQDANDEPASVLLKKIAEEKQQLVKDKRIKKPKSLPEIFDMEIPYLLPTGWSWVRLQDITKYIQRGKGPKYADDGKVKVISQKCIQWNRFDLDKARFVTDESLESYQEERFLIKNDLLWNSTGTGTVGRIIVLSDVKKESLVADSHVTVIRPLTILSSFLCSYVSAPGIQLRIDPAHEDSLVSGTTKQVELNTGTIAPLLVPIPPLAEQHRIVAKVDELMALCDQLEQEQADHQATHQTLVKTLLNGLIESAKHSEPVEGQSTADYFNQLIAEHFDTLFTTEQSIDQLKQTILQLAVMGKLVPQDPSDEPASVLLEKIAKEKAKLIAEGKIKKQKALSEITENEKPYKLPEKWQWSRIGASSLSTDYGLSEKTFDNAVGVPVLKMGDIKNGEVILGGQKTVSEEVDGLPELFLIEGDLLYNRTNSAELVGKTGVFIGSKNIYTFASYLIRIRLDQDLVTPKYLNICMNSPSFRETQINPHLKQQCGQANVNGTIMKNMRVPIPPYNEQHRIVTKVNQLLVLCDSLKANLNQSQTTQTQLADAIVKQAVN